MTPTGLHPQVEALRRERLAADVRAVHELTAPRHVPPSSTTSSRP